jgi:hypothetical protein
MHAVCPPHPVLLDLNHTNEFDKDKKHQSFLVLHHTSVLGMNIIPLHLVLCILNRKSSLRMTAELSETIQHCASFFFVKAGYSIACWHS